MFLSRGGSVEFSVARGEKAPPAKEVTSLLLSGAAVKQPSIKFTHPSLPRLCSAITANDVFKGPKRVTSPAFAIFETFRGARGSLNRVSLVCHHVVWFTAARRGRVKQPRRLKLKGDRDQE